MGKGAFICTNDYLREFALMCKMFLACGYNKSCISKAPYEGFSFG